MKHSLSHSQIEKARTEKSERLARLKQTVEALREGRLNSDAFNATMAAAQDLVIQISGSSSAPPAVGQ